MTLTELVFDPISRNEQLDAEVLDLVRPGLTVYAGPMFSGKSGELIRTIDRIGHRFRDPESVHPDEGPFDVSPFVVAFSPLTNTRDNEKDKHFIASRGTLNTRITYPAVGLPSREPWRILEAAHHRYPWVMIDEGNFWGYERDDGYKRSGLKETVQMLVEQGREVHIAGLSQDFRGEPFGEMGDLLAIADSIVLLRGETSKGPDATRTQRRIGARPAAYDSPVIVVGDSEAYACRRPEDHRVPGKRTHLIETLGEYARTATD
jgi:thymidine kinase